MKTTKKRTKSKKRNHLKKEVSSFLDEFEPDHEGFTVAELSEKQNKPNEKAGNNFKTSKKLASNKPAISQQLASKESFNKPAIGQPLASNKPAKKSRHSANKPADKPADKPAIGQQLASKTAQNQGVHDLIGKEAKLTDIIFFDCQNRGALETSNLTTEFLKTELEISSRRLRNLIERLTKKCVVEVSFSKRGNGGLRRFKLSSENYHKIAMSAKQQKTNKPAISQQLASMEGVHKPADKPARPSSSSSLISSKQKTTTSDDRNSPLSSITIPEDLTIIGINQNHLSQIETKFPQAIPNLQRSLEALAYDIEQAGGVEAFRRENRINNPIGWFFGSIKAGGYESKNEGFLTSEEQGERETLRRLKKKQEKREEEKRELEKRMFREWLDPKTDEELREIVEPPGQVRGDFHLELLKSHFIKNEMAYFQKQISRELGVTS